MEKHYEIEKRFVKEGTATVARNQVLESFIQDCGGRAYQFAYSLSGNSEEAKELVQEALYQVARNWKQFDQTKSLDAWLFTILRNAFLRSRRRSDRKKGVSLDLEMESGSSYAEVLSDGVDFTEELERNETVVRVRQAMKDLTSEQRAILKLCDMDGLKYRQIARSLGIPAGTVRSRISRARAALRNDAPELAALAH